jgi:hypothetical protein
VLGGLEGRTMHVWVEVQGWFTEDRPNRDTSRVGVRELS